MVKYKMVEERALSLERCIAFQSGNQLRKGKNLRIIKTAQADSLQCLMPHSSKGQAVEKGLLREFNCNYQNNALRRWHVYSFCCMFSSISMVMFNASISSTSWPLSVKFLICVITLTNSFVFFLRSSCRIGQSVLNVRLAALANAVESTRPIDRRLVQTGVLFSNQKSNMYKIRKLAHEKVNLIRPIPQQG